MRARLWVAVGALTLLSLGLAANAQQTSPPDPMSGMDMGQSANRPNSTDSGAGMDMGHCGGMGHCMGATQNKTALPAGAMRITYAGKSSDWTLSALANLPHKSITVRNEHTKANETYSGVALIDLLSQLGIPAKPHGKDLGLYLAAVGSDGYKAVYSVAEVNPDVHDATVIVADAKDGKPLTADGPLKLVATRDTRPARWVRNLVAIHVMTAQ